MQSFDLPRAVAAALTLALVACSSDRAALPVTQDAGPPDVDVVADAIAPSDAGEPVGPADCGEENKQIYVLSAGRRALHRFDPANLTFTRIGDLDCPTSADTFSMAVDRKGVAWVEYNDGRMFHVDTKTAHCKEIPFHVGQAGFSRFGMGFAKDDSPEGESLFVEGDALGTIDQKTYVLRLVGATGVGLAELTGTGNGLLFAFDVNSGRVVELDKANGDVKKIYRTGAIDPNGSWAFAQWGGDFWLFTGQATSQVTRYSPATNESKVVVPDVGFVIVGAGSSTCAPYEPPR